MYTAKDRAADDRARHRTKQRTNNQTGTNTHFFFVGIGQARIFLSYSSQCETSEMRVSIERPRKKLIIMRIRSLMRIRSSSLDQEADTVWVMSLNFTHLFVMHIHIYNAYSHMCKATGNSHHAPVSQPFLNFVKFHTILNMGPKLRARKADEPSEELQDIRKKMAKLSKWLPGREKAVATEEQEETEADPGDQPGESAPSQATEAAQSAGKK